MLLKYFVSLTIFRKFFGSVLRCSSQWLCETSKETSCMESFSTEAAVLKQSIKITPRFCKLFCLYFFVLRFVSYINLNHKDTTHPQGRRLDPTFYIDQNVSQTCQPEFLKIWRMRIVLFKNIGRFQPKQGHFKIKKKNRLCRY